MPSRCAHAARASRSSSATVSARHSTTSGEPTSCSRSASPGSRKVQHARVDEQAAVAVFGKARQAVDVGHLDAGRLQRLDQRVGQPLRQLVQRHEPARGVVGGERRMAPAIAERHAAELEPRRPDRPELAQQLRAGWRARRCAATRPARRDDRTGRRGAAHRRARRPRVVPPPLAPSRRSRSARPCEAGQRIGVASPGSGGRSARRSGFAAPLASARNGDADRAENAPSANMSRLASARPSERPTVGARSRVAIGPARPGAGIEQHADDGEVECGARALGRVAPRRGAVDRGPAIVAADHEMPPARMERHVERGIGLARRRDDEVGGRVEPRQDRCGNAAARPRARSPAADARARAPPRRSKAKGCRRLGLHERTSGLEWISTCRASGRRCPSGPAAWALAARNSRRPSWPRSPPARRPGPARRGSAPARRSRCPARVSASYFMSLMETKRSMRCKPEPMDHVRHQLLEARVLHAGDALGALEIGRGRVAALLALARVVDQELGDLAERPALLAVVDDDAEAAGLRRARAFLDAVHEIGPAGADVGAEHVRAVALVVHAAGDRRARDRRAWRRRRTDRRWCRRSGGRNTCRSGRVTSSGNMPAVCSNRVRRKLVSVGAEALGDAGQVPDRIDGDLDDRQAAVRLHDRAVIGEPPGRERLLGSPADRGAPASRRCWAGCRCLRRSRSRKASATMCPQGSSETILRAPRHCSNGPMAAAGCVLVRSARRMGLSAPEETASAR